MILTTSLIDFKECLHPCSLEKFFYALAGIHRRSDMHFGIDVDDEVLHKAMTVVKESTFIDQVVKFVVDTKEDCTKNDGCLCKIVCDDS
ncbi:hypothetical protein Tco_0710892 [Tanacetum coccineum]